MGNLYNKCRKRRRNHKKCAKHMNDVIKRKKNSTECEASEAPDTRQSGVATPLFRTCGAHYSPSELQNIMAEISTASILKISDEKTLQLIDLYYNEDCLWNTNSENYKNKERRSLAAEKIAAILDLPNFTAKHVMIKFKNLRDSYSQELKKITHSLALGDEHKYVPKVFWFSKMDSFIRPHLQGRFSKSASFTKNEPLADELEWTQLDDAELSPDHGGGEEFLIPITSRAKASDGECSEPKRRKLPARRTRDKRKNSETTIAETLKDIQSQLHVLTANNDDCHDTFGKYVASLLRALSPQRALALQPMIVSLITGAADEDPLSAVPDNLTQDVEIKLEITE